MNDRMPRLLALDIDGTITNSEHRISPRTISSIRKAIEAGIEVVLATGRRYRDALTVANQTEIHRPLVTTAGALIKAPLHHHTHFRATFPDGVLQGVLELIDGAGQEAIVYTDSFDDGFDFHCRGLDRGGDGLRSYLARNRSLARVSPHLHEQPPADSFAAFCMGSEAEMRALDAAIRGAYSDGTSLHVIRSPRYQGYLCEIAPAGITKWSGIEQLAGAWGIPAEAICAVGDDLNDVPMIRAAGLGVAMGNADPRVQDVADRVIGSNDTNALADLIDELLLRAPYSSPSP
jgi:hydroxymethylpyrimidine pyrophosphatase-like HAD family hydrolase